MTINLYTTKYADVAKLADARVIMRLLVNLLSANIDLMAIIPFPIRLCLTWARRSSAKEVQSIMTINLYTTKYADVAKLADALDLGSSG